jgi:molybdopterin synthase sulfur carrier subunit
MPIQILYFAWVREKIGQDGETITFPEEVGTVAELIGWLRSRSDGHAEALADLKKLRVAIDQAFASMETPVASAREIAIFPPVTGG